MTPIHVSTLDSVEDILEKITTASTSEVVLAIPRGSLLFTDSLLLRKLATVLKKREITAYILTSDSLGQQFAKEAGFKLKFKKRKPAAPAQSVAADIRTAQAPRPSFKQREVVVTAPEFEVVSSEELEETFEDSQPKQVSYFNSLDVSIVEPTVVSAAEVPQQSVQHSEQHFPAVSIHEHDLEEVLTPESEQIITEHQPSTIRTMVAALPFIGRFFPLTHYQPIQSSSDLPGTSLAATIDSEENPLNTVAEDPMYGDATTDLESIRKPVVQHKGLISKVAAVVAGVLILALLTLLLLPQATVTVYGKSQTVNRQFDITVNTQETAPANADLSLPGSAVNQTLQVNQTFQTTGKKEVGTKSQGKVIIYNLTGQPLNLLATTTLLSAGGNTYVFNTDQRNIKPLASSADESGTVADITAQTAGETNIPVGTRLEITNNKFGTQPQRLYAKVVDAVVGGRSRSVSVISKEDIDGARASLVKAAAEQINQSMSDRGIMLLDGSYINEVLEFTTDKPEGSEIPVLTASAKIQISGLAFKRADLLTMLRQRLQQSLASGQQLQEANQDTVTTNVRKLDLSAGVMQLGVDYQSGYAQPLDAGAIAKSIAGKNPVEAEQILLNRGDVKRAEFVISPSWQKNLPRIPGKITIVAQ